MKNSEYLEEEKALIKKWGYCSDSNYDTNRKVVNPVTGKRVSCLDLAQTNQRAFFKIIALKKLKNYGQS
jgi:hypothetical protein